MASATPRTRHARTLFSGLGGDYDRWSAVLSFGQDPRWRRFLVDRCPAVPGDHVLDVATGTGLVARTLARRYGCWVTGIDQSPEMLTGARERLARDPVAGPLVTLVEGRAEELPFGDATFDGLTCTYLLRYVDDPQAALRELVRTVKPGRPISYLDFALPPRGPLRLAWDVYTGVGLPAAGRVISPAWYEVGRFLRGSIRRFCADHDSDGLLRLFINAGVQDAQVRRMSLGGGVVVWGRRDAG
jgi:demethylmenaquinone methyltransferase / 2-methoxy-6-polyprenyl-1,4-benzoquinol methylase